MKTKLFYLCLFLMAAALPGASSFNASPIRKDAPFWMITSALKAFFGF